MRWSVVAVGLLAFALANAQVPNGNFESWDDPNTPTGWTHDSGITIDQESGTVYQGSYSAKVTLTTQSQSNADFQSDFFSVTGGTDYRFSFWILDNDPAGKARVVADWYDASQSYLSSNYGSYSSDDANWQEVTNTYTAPSNAAYAKFRIRFYDEASNWDGDAVFYVDSVTAEAAAPSIDTVSIYDIQGQTSSSPYEGSKVCTYGIVTAVFGNGFFLEERPGGAWHGIYVYTAGAPSVNQGDSLEVVADVQEYNGLTELTNPSINTLATGLSLPGPTTITLADFGEDYEGVFVKVEYVKVSDPDLGYGEWEITDGTNTGRVDDMGSYTYDHNLGDSLNFIQGPLTYTYGNFKLEPRDDNDIEVGNYAPDTVSSPDTTRTADGFIVGITWNDGDGTIVDDSLYYRVDTNPWEVVYHDSVTTTRAGGTYWYTIPPQSSGTTLEYYGMAKDNLGGRNETQVYQTTPVAVAEQSEAPTLTVHLKTPVSRGEATVAFTLPHRSQVHLALYDATGRLVRILYQGTLPAGPQEIHTVLNLQAGVYFVATRVNGRSVATHRLVLLK